MYYHGFAKHRPWMRDATRSLKSVKIGNSSGSEANAILISLSLPEILERAISTGKNPIGRL